MIDPLNSNNPDNIMPLAGESMVERWYRDYDLAAERNVQQVLDFLPDTKAEEVLAEEVPPRKFPWDYVVEDYIESPLEEDWVYTVGDESFQSGGSGVERVSVIQEMEGR